MPVFAIGKIVDLFAGQGISESVHTASDDEGMDQVERAMAERPGGLIVANLVDFDTVYGHRNNVERVRAESRAVRRAALRAAPEPAAR